MDSLYRPRTIGDGALVVAQPQLRVSAGVERQGVSRIDLDRLVERLHRFGELLLFGQVTPLPVKPIRILRRVWTRIGARRKNLWRLDRGRLYHTGPWRQLRRGDERHHHVARAGDSLRSREPAAVMMAQAGQLKPPAPEQQELEQRARDVPRPPQRAGVAAREPRDGILDSIIFCAGFSNVSRFRRILADQHGPINIFNGRLRGPVAR